MKAVTHKYHKGGVAAQPADSMSEDEKPLVTTNGNGRHIDKPHANGVNGHQMLSEDEMSEDDIPLATPINGKKRKAASSLESESDDDTPLASSSPVKPALKSSRLGAAGTAASVSTRQANPRATSKRGRNISYKEESSDDDRPLVLSQATSAPTQSSTPRPSRKKAKVVKEESDDDRPLSSQTKRDIERESEDEGEDADSESPAPTRKRKPKIVEAKKAKPAPTKRKPTVKDESDQDESSKKGKAKAKGKAEKPPASPRKKAKKEESEEVYKWWDPEAAPEDVLGDGTVKWKTLVHQGVLFPPPYDLLPKDVQFYYDGKPVDLHPAAEEVAYFFAKLLGGDHVHDPVFQTNFFREFVTVLKEHPPRDGTKISEFEKCDFRKIYDYITAEKDKKKGWTKEQKLAEKEKRDLAEEPFRTCLMDGRKEQVGNFRVEPPGLFLGRGEHPKKGMLKHRLRPEDIVINIGGNAPIPTPNVPGKWKSVIHDNTVTWLANWKENINGTFKYVFLAASSSLKGQSDMNKFEKARELKKYVDQIRRDYQVDLRSKVMADRQRATAMYFIDKLALRAGNEKGEDEADTVGCCSLRCEHVTLDPPDRLVFDFLGKDSIRYYNTVQVELQAFKNIRIFKDNKNDDDALFDRVTTGGLNKHLQSYMKGLTAKVFRTYNASITLQQQLDDNTPADASVMEKLAAYNKANRMVAVLCNHQKSVSKGHGDSMAKMADKLRGMKYDRMKLRHAMFVIDPKKKKAAKYADLESDLDDDFIERWEDGLREKDIEKAKKKFAKDNETKLAEGETAQDDSVLDDVIQGIEDEYKRLAKERGTNKAELKRARPVEKIEDAIESLDTRIKNFKIQMDDKEEGKQVSLGTSKINYLDPRITAAWCSKHDVPISKIFSKSLLVKFPWALGIDPDWKF